MKQAAALQIIEEAQQDKRLSATLNTKKTQRNHDGGYRIDITLRKFQVHHVIVNQEDWQVIRDMWEGL